jgi:hypothetical protein
MLNPVVFSAAFANESGIVKKRPPPHIKKRRQSRRVTALPKKESGLFSKDRIIDYKTKKAIWRIQINHPQTYCNTLTRINRKFQNTNTKFQMVRQAHHPEPSRRVNHNDQNSKSQMRI